MKYLFLIATAFTIAACSNSMSTVAVEHQVISPHSLIFPHGVSSQTVSITHTCTCPFVWYVTVINPNAVFSDTTGDGDNPNVTFTINRTKLTADTLTDAWQIRSIYGYDTVQVKVMK